MYHIYEIELKNGEKYVGCTNNIQRRTTQHNDNIKNKRNRFSKYISSQFKNPRGIGGVIISIIQNVINRAMYKNAVLKQASFN